MLRCLTSSSARVKRSSSERRSSPECVVDSSASTELNLPKRIRPTQVSRYLHCWYAYPRLQAAGYRLEGHLQLCPINIFQDHVNTGQYSMHRGPISLAEANVCEGWVVRRLELEETNQCYQAV
jgi:hypothetical protein